MAWRALITGGSNGLGRALADQLAGEGWDVISVDLKKPKGKFGFQHITCDMSDRVALDVFIEQLSEGEAFDLVVFNAGINATGKFETMPYAAVEKVVRVNAEAPMVLASQLAGKGLIKEGGRMSFIASLSCFTGYPGAAAYAASKDAIAIYVKSIRKPFVKLGISVSCCFPGPLKTNHADRHSPKDASDEKRMTAEIAAALILADIKRDRKRIFPGNSTKLAALSGKLLPMPMTWLMRKFIYDKLDKNTF